jgi:hypothetical protein
MADTITTKGSLVTAWTDAIEATLPDPTVTRLIGTPIIQPIIRAITNTSGTNLTLSSTLGLFPGTRIQLVVTAGTIPPEATPGYIFQVKTVSGNIITVAHDVSAPVVNWGSGVTATWEVRDEELTIVSPTAQWDYYAYTFHDVALTTNTKFLPVTRSKIFTASKTYDINYSRGSFRRSTAVGVPATYTIKHYAIVEVDNATTPTASASIIHQITLENPVVLTGTTTTSTNISLTSAFILE